MPLVTWSMGIKNTNEQQEQKMSIQCTRVYTSKSFLLVASRTPAPLTQNTAFLQISLSLSPPSWMDTPPNADWLSVCCGTPSNPLSTAFLETAYCTFKSNVHLIFVIVTCLDKCSACAGWWYISQCVIKGFTAVAKRDVWPSEIDFIPFSKM